MPEKREIHVVYLLGDRTVQRIVTDGALTSLIVLALIGRETTDLGKYSGLLAR